MAAANLESSGELRNLHSDGLFKSGLSEELQVFYSNSCHLALGLFSGRFFTFGILLKISMILYLIDCDL